LSLPVEFGGDGFGHTELAVVLEEFGRALVPGPFLPTVVLAAGALLESGDVRLAGEILPGVATGRTIATLATFERDGRWRTQGFATRAERIDGAWRLHGEKVHVLSAVASDVMVVSASCAEGPTLFLVDTDADGVTVEDLRVLDLTRRSGRVSFSGAAARPLGEIGAASKILDRVLCRATTALAAEQVGIARACLDASVSYAKERVQFGRVIGSFQAVKHKCADMFVRLELASAAASDAARTLDGFDDHLPSETAAAIAHATCSEAAMFAATENIQVHGGIGFTWEHPAHLYFRRAKADQLMFGGPAEYFERVLVALEG
jgi:alkylation response protein AidB-like acyl-CoA dehydrogenase